MKRFLILALAAIGGSASAVVLDFEDLSGQSAMVDGYGGVADWGTWEHYDWEQSPYTAASGSQRIYSPSDQSFSFAGDVVFNGAFVAGQALPVSFLMYNDGVPVFTSAVLVPSDVPTFLASGYAGAVDKVEVIGVPANYVLDDVSFDAVPEPASLVALGVGALALIRRRRGR